VLRCEKTARNYGSFVPLACAFILIKSVHSDRLREKLKAGAKLEDFAVQKNVPSRKASPKKIKKRRKAKR